MRISLLWTYNDTFFKIHFIHIHRVSHYNLPTQLSTELFVVRKNVLNKTLFRRGHLFMDKSLVWVRMLPRFQGDFVF